MSRGQREFTNLADVEVTDEERYGWNCELRPYFLEPAMTRKVTNGV